MRRIRGVTALIWDDVVAELLLIVQGPAAKGAKALLPEPSLQRRAIPERERTSAGHDLLLDALATVRILLARPAVGVLNAEDMGVVPAVVLPWLRDALRPLAA